MKRYKLIRADNFSDSKKGGVDIYLKEFTAVRPVKVKNAQYLKCPLKTKWDMWSHSIDRLIKHKTGLTFF